MEMLTQVKFCYKMAAPSRLQLPVDGLPPWDQAGMLFTTVQVLHTQ